VITASYHVSHQVWCPTVDTHNAPVDNWGPPETVTVYGWAPTTGSTETAPGRDKTTSRLDLYLPGRLVCGHRDLWIILGEPWYQTGDLDDYSFGPTRHGGCVVHLSRTKG